MDIERSHGAAAGRARLPALAASGVVAGFLLLEGRLRQGSEARSLQAGDADRGTTRAIGAAVPLAVGGPPLASALRIRHLPVGVGWLGTALAAGGVALRVWAARVLGASYTRTLRVRDAQPLVETGPYALVRHPGYAGALAMWTGYALSWRSLPALSAIGPMLVAYLRRIAAEEEMLDRVPGGGYRRYRQRTRRLIPGIY